MEQNPFAKYKCSYTLNIGEHGHYSFQVQDKKNRKARFLAVSFYFAVFLENVKNSNAKSKQEKLQNLIFDFAFLYFARYFSLPDFCSGITCDFRVASIEFVFILGTKFARFGGMPKIIILKNRPEKGIVITHRKIDFCDFALFKFEIRFLKIRHFRKSKLNTQKSEF